MQANFCRQTFVLPTARTPVTGNVDQSRKDGCGQRVSPVIPSRAYPTLLGSLTFHGGMGGCRLFVFLFLFCFSPPLFLLFSFSFFFFSLPFYLSYVFVFIFLSFFVVVWCFFSTMGKLVANTRGQI